MQPEHPAAELIAEAKFARRMLDVVDASLDKIVAAAQPAPPAGPVRLEVPTLNPAGWTDAVLYVIRTERAKTTPAREIAAMLERLFGVEASAHVVMSAVLHFDLDRREVMTGPITVDVTIPTEVPVLETPCGGMTGAEWEAEQQASDLLVDEAPREVVESAPEVDQPAYTVDAARDPASASAWIDEAKRLYAAGCGLNPFAIAKQLGRTDYEVRKAVIPGYGTREHRDNLRAQTARPAPSLPPAAPPKPKPREPKTKPTRETVTVPAPKRALERKPSAVALPEPLPWSPPAKEPTLATGIPAEGEGVALLDLTVDSCRWPMGKGGDGHETYCGCQKSRYGGSYCEAHAKRAYREWPPSTPVPKLPTRMARRLSALPAQQNRNAQRRA